MAQDAGDLGCLLKVRNPLGSMLERALFLLSIFLLGDPIHSHGFNYLQNTVKFKICPCSPFFWDRWTSSVCPTACISICVYTMICSQAWRIHTGMFSSSLFSYTPGLWKKTSRDILFTISYNFIYIKNIWVPMLFS